MVLTAEFILTLFGVCATTLMGITMCLCKKAEKKELKEEEEKIQPLVPPTQEISTEVHSETQTGTGDTQTKTGNGTLVTGYTVGSTTHAKKGRKAARESARIVKTEEYVGGSKADMRDSSRVSYSTMYGVKSIDNTKKH